MQRMARNTIRFEPDHVCVYTSLAGPLAHKIDFQSTMASPLEEFQGPLQFMAMALTTQIMQITFPFCKATKGIESFPKRQFKLRIAGIKIAPKPVEIAISGEAKSLL